MQGDRFGEIVRTLTLKTGANAGREALVVLLDSGAHRTYLADDCKWMIP
jgi:hypothetical protein